MKLLTTALTSSLLVLGIACRAEPAPDSGFIENPEQMKADDNMPFNAVWFSPDLKWGKYNKIVIAPVDTTHLEKMDWWDKASLADAVESPEEEVVVLAKYMKEQLTDDFKNDPKKHFTVIEPSSSETPGGTPSNIDGQTLILETALVEVVPTKVWLNAISYIVVGAIDLGTAAMEGRFRDGATGEVIGKFKDREHGQMSLVSVADLQWYSHAHHIIDHWSEQLVEITDSHPGEIIEANYTVTLRPW